MAKYPAKADFPVAHVRRYLEPGADRPGVVRIGWQAQYHDDGLAHRHGVQTITCRLCHRRQRPQLRLDPSSTWVSLCRQDAKHPEALHYTGDGVFMVAGKIVSRRRLFKPELPDT